MMKMNVAPKVISQTQEFWAKIGIEIDNEQAEEIACTFLELINLIQSDREFDHEEN